MEDVIRTKVMTLSLLSEWLTKQSPSETSLLKFNMWLEKVVAFSRQGSTPPGPAPRQGLEWKPETHRWIRPEEETVREESRQPRLREIQDYLETGGFAEISERANEMLKELFPDMLNPESISRLKKVGSIQEKENRKKYKEMPKEKAVKEGIITEDEEWDGMKYNHFTDIVAGRVSFNNVSEVSDAVQVLHDKQEELGFEITEDENYINDPQDGYYRRYHMLIKMKTDAGKTVTMEVQLGTANQTRIADWAHDVFHKKGADRPILTTKDKLTALKYVRQMSELYAYHDGVEGAKNIYPAECVEVVKKFAGCLDVP
jgi:ppGpp synthetase/RelA/SpoT-type nucleotidyltranferase